MRVPFEVVPGLWSDDTIYATPGRWADGSNVRFRLGVAEPIGGWTEYIATALTGVCRNIYAWKNQANQLNVVFGTNTRLQVYFGGTLSNITPSGLIDGYEDEGTVGGYGTGGYEMGGYGTGELDAKPRVWALDSYGENLLAAPRLGTLYVWENDPSSAATAVANAPDAIIDICVTGKRQVIAFGTEEEASGIFNPLCIRGSDFEDYTDWTSTATNNAFEKILEGGTTIVAGRNFSERLAVWTESAVHLGTYIGSPTEIYRFDRVSDDAGLIGRNALAITNRVAYWLSPDYRFFAWPFGGIPQEIPCPILRDFRDNVDMTQTGKIMATTVSRFNEIWWFYPDSRDDDENSRYIAFNYAENVWTRGTVARTAATDNGVLSYPLFVDVAGGTYLHENGNDADGGALSWHIESAPQYVDEAERMVLFRDIWPDVKDQTGDVSLTITLRDYPQGTDRTKGPYTLASSADKYDFLAQGRLAKIKFSGNAAGTFARIGKPSFDVTATGKR